MFRKFSDRKYNSQVNRSYSLYRSGSEKLPSACARGVNSYIKIDGVIVTFGGCLVPVKGMAVPFSQFWDIERKNIKESNYKCQSTVN